MLSTFSRIFIDEKDPKKHLRGDEALPTGLVRLISSCETGRIVGINLTIDGEMVRISKN